ETRAILVVPVTWLGPVTVKVDDEAAGVACRSTEGIRIGDDVGFYVAGAAHEHLHLVGIVLAVGPVALADCTPHARPTIEAHGEDGGFRAGRRVIYVQLR